MMLENAFIQPIQRHCDHGNLRVEKNAEFVIDELKFKSFSSVIVNTKLGCFSSMYSFADLFKFTRPFLVPINR